MADGADHPKFDSAKVRAVLDSHYGAENAANATNGYTFYISGERIILKADGSIIAHGKKHDAADYIAELKGIPLAEARALIERPSPPKPAPKPQPLPPKSPVSVNATFTNVAPSQAPEKPFAGLIPKEAIRRKPQKPRYLIDRFLEVGATTLLWGPDGSAKTQTIVAAAAFGAVKDASFTGFKKSNPFRSLIVTPEDAETMVLRLQAASEFWRQKQNDLAGEAVLESVRIFDTIKAGKEFTFDSTDGLGTLDAVLTHLKDSGSPISALMLDSISLMTSPQSADINAVPRKVYTHAAKLAKDHSLGVLIVQHSNKLGDAPDGTSYWLRPCKYRYRLKKPTAKTIKAKQDDPATDVLFYIEDEKMRNAAPGSFRKAFKILPVKIDGEEIDGATVIPELFDPKPSENKKTSKGSDAGPALAAHFQKINKPSITKAELWETAKELKVTKSTAKLIHSQTLSRWRDALTVAGITILDDAHSTPKPRKKRATKPSAKKAQKTQ